MIVINLTNNKNKMIIANKNQKENEEKLQIIFPSLLIKIADMFNAVNQ